MIPRTIVGFLKRDDQAILWYIQELAITGNLWCQLLDTYLVVLVIFCEGLAYAMQPASSSSRCPPFVGGTQRIYFSSIWGHGKTSPMVIPSKPEALIKRGS